MLLNGLSVKIVASFLCCRTRAKIASVVVRAFLPSTKMLVKHLALPRLLREMLRLTSILDLKVLCTDLKMTRGSSEGLARHQTLGAICNE